MTSEQGAVASVDQVRVLAREAYAGVADFDGSPHILHCERVAAAVEGDEEKMAALLHDVLEDSSLTAEDLYRAGVPGVVVEAVAILTKSRDDVYEVYIERVARTPGEAGDLARRIKIADLEDNLARSEAAALSDYVAKYRKALRRLEGGAAA